MIANWLKERHNVKINVDYTDRWENVEIPDDTLTLLLLKYKGNYHDTI
jgi:hypothetical protein